MIPLGDQLTLLLEGCSSVISEHALKTKLALGHPLRVKFGVDPTSSDIHLGHTVALNKLRQFQILGHEAILIIGDFTSMIGDPSGRSATRPHLAHAQIIENAKTYQEQAFRILDPDKTIIRHNGEWFSKMIFQDIMQLNSRVTLQQILHREDFRERIDKGLPIHLHEIQYPLMQGWDSVMIRSDVELGGNDQLFNLLVGRHLQEEEGQEQQVAMMMPILTGLDGKQKMSKSLGNAIGLTESPHNMFGKLMSIADEQMREYYALLLQESFPMNAHPIEAKKTLAERVTARFHSAEDARHAREDFELRFSKRDLNAVDLPAYAPHASCPRDIVSLGVDAFQQTFGINKSRGEIRRLVESGSFSWRGEKILSPHTIIPVEEIGVLKMDRRHAVRIE